MPLKEMLNRGAKNAALLFLTLGDGPALMPMPYVLLQAEMLCQRQSPTLQGLCQ